MTRNWTEDDIETTRETISIDGWTEREWDGSSEVVPTHSTIVDGWRLRGCDWLAVTTLPSSNAYTITHTRTGACLLSDAGNNEHPVPSPCSTRDEALDLLARLSREEWLRDLKPKSGAEAAARFCAIVARWRAA